jgi:hypothetical protein
MSIYFFSSDINSMEAVARLKTAMDKLVSSKQIDRWHLDMESPEHILEVETVVLTPEQTKHYIRAAKFDVEFTMAPQARQAAEKGFL